MYKPGKQTTRAGLLAPGCKCEYLYPCQLPGSNMQHGRATMLSVAEEGQRSPVQEGWVTLCCCRGFYISYNKELLQAYWSLQKGWWQVILGAIRFTQVCFDKTWDPISSYFNNLSKTKMEFFSAFFFFCLEDHLLQKPQLF